jgi:hypothetical protein
MASHEERITEAEKQIEAIWKKEEGWLAERDIIIQWRGRVDTRLDYLDRLGWGVLGGVIVAVIGIVTKYILDYIK